MLMCCCSLELCPDGTVTHRLVREQEDRQTGERERDRRGERERQ